MHHDLKAAPLVEQLQDRGIRVLARAQPRDVCASAQQLADGPSGRRFVGAHQPTYRTKAEAAGTLIAPDFLDGPLIRNKALEAGEQEGHAIGQAHADLHVRAVFLVEEEVIQEKLEEVGHPPWQLVHQGRADCRNLEPRKLVRQGAGAQLQKAPVD